MSEETNTYFQESIEKIYNDEWRCRHEQTLKEFFPRTFTHIGNIDDDQLKQKLKILGIDIRQHGELGDILEVLVEKRIILRNGMTVKRNPHDCFYD